MASFPVNSYPPQFVQMPFAQTPLHSYPAVPKPMPLVTYKTPKTCDDDVTLHLTNETFTVVEMDKDCMDKFKDVITLFINHTAPTQADEFVKEKMYIRAHEVLQRTPYVLNSVNPETNELFLAFIGNSSFDSTENFCRDNVVATSGRYIHIKNDGSSMVLESPDPTAKRRHYSRDPNDRRDESLVPNSGIVKAVQEELNRPPINYPLSFRGDKTHVNESH